MASRSLLAAAAIAASIAAVVIAVIIDRRNQPPPAPTLEDLHIAELEARVQELETVVTKLNAIGADPEIVEPCDAAALVAEGKRLDSASDGGAALTAFAQALDCEPSSDVALLAAMAACKQGQGADAARYAKLAAPDQRPAIQQACRAHGIALD